MSENNVNAELGKAIFVMSTLVGIAVGCITYKQGIPAAGYAILAAIIAMFVFRSLVKFEGDE